MNILIVNTRHYNYGGDSVYAFNLAELLRERGHQVSFFAMQGDANLPDPNTDLFVSHIDYRALNQRKNPITALKVVTRSIYSTEARHKFAQILDRTSPDIIHLQSIHAHITPSVIYEARQRRIPVVWTLHDYKTICPNSACLIDKTGDICEACQGGKFWQALVKRCKKDSVLASGMASLEAYAHDLMNVRTAVDAFIAPSRFLRERLLLNGFSQKTVHHLPSFLPSHLFHQAGQDQGYLLFKGRLEGLKGLFVLADAARLAPDVPIIVVGSAAPNILDQLPGLLPPNVQYLGFKTGQELFDITYHARALLFPSQCYENQPLSILEAFACGKPAIATNIGGMPELIGADRGLLVPFGDPRALADAMQKITSDPVQARQLGANAFEYARSNHSPDSHYLQLSQLYDGLLSR